MEEEEEREPRLWDHLWIWLFVLAVLFFVPGTRRWLVMNQGIPGRAVVSALEPASGGHAKVTLSFQYKKDEAVTTDIYAGPRALEGLRLYEPVDVRYLRWLPSWPELEDDGGTAGGKTAGIGLLLAATALLALAYWRLSRLRLRLFPGRRRRSAAELLGLGLDGAYVLVFLGLVLRACL